MRALVVGGLVGMIAALCGAPVRCGEGAAAGEDKQPKFTWHVEAKLSFRSSHDVHPDVGYASALAHDSTGAALVNEPPHPGTSLEPRMLSVTCDAAITPDIRAAVKVHLLDLYDRNPTSSDDRVFLREAWVQFGQKDDAFQRAARSSFYLLIGKAARFTKQRDRRLESYGLLGNAIGRFEQVQVQAGGSLGRHLYWRAHLANPNPLFFRDPNALAGDNGVPGSRPGGPGPDYGTGFVMLYDAKAGDINFSGKYEAGGGLGLRFTKDDGTAWLDTLGWLFKRQLADHIPIRGTSLSGDLELLRGGGNPLPITGRDKTEYGISASGRVRAFRFFAQAANQDIAGLTRTGYEFELAYFFALPGLCASGDTPVVNWIQPALRFSSIDNRFTVPPDFLYPAIAWDWSKLDAGFRLGIVRGVDLTVEYSRHNMRLADGNVLHPDEFLATLRVSH